MSRQKLNQHWNDWQLNSLVLLSLLLQLLLLSTGRLRKRMRPSKLNKAYFWALYNASSPIVIYGLGVLSRATAGLAADADEKDASGPAACTTSLAGIQAFWAALLLFHLGGVDDFTALSLEDNSLWIRRCFSLSVQAATTIYVFFHYFQDSSFRVFIGPFWLIFVAGQLKCVELVLALQQATMEALIGSVLGTPDPGPDYADTMDRVDGILRSGELPRLNIDDERLDRPNSDDTHDEVVYNKEDPRQAVEITRSAHFLFQTFKVLFADGIFSFKDRQDSRAEFLKKDKDWAFKVVEMELSFVYDRLYTKASVSRTKWGLPMRFASLALTLAGSVWALFITLHAKLLLRHKCVTYTLLAGAVVTDAVTLASHSFSTWSIDWLQCCSCLLVNRRRWSGHMAQSNLITFCLQLLPSYYKWEAAVVRKILAAAGRSTRTAATRLLEFSLASPAFGRFVDQELELKAAYDLLNSTWFQKLRERIFWVLYKQTEHVPVGEELKAFIFREIRGKERSFSDWERQRSSGPAGNTNNPFTSYRGDQVLRNEAIAGLEWSLQEKEFDESLLIWHIATDLCFRQERHNQKNSTQADHDHEHDEADTTTCSCRKHMDMASELSNYLFYIMAVHPLMLSPPTTMATKRCQDTIAEARRHLLKEDLQHMHRPSTDEARVSEDSAHNLLLKVETPLPAAVVKGDKSKSVLWDGCFLAKELARAMPDRATRWRVVCRVWVEMLCYAAVHCGGYQHAERLKEGGELITFVCLLMTHLGMGKHYRTEVGDAFAHLTAYNV